MASRSFRFPTGRGAEHVTTEDRLAFATLDELARGLASGDWSSVDVVRACLERIRRFDPALHAYVAVDEAAALAQAEAADARRRARLSLGRFDGVPVAIKDLLDIDGQACGAGSAAWAARRGSVTAAVVQRLLAAGMIVLGRTQMVEFAFGGWGTNPLLGTPVNPWDRQTHRIPGGSSSGSAVAVAAGLAPAALGSDTGGSIRIPAALNGITGLKPTASLVDLAGAVPLSSTLDSIGPLTRDVTDAGWLLALIANPASMPAGHVSPCATPDFRAALEGSPDLRGVRIAVLAEDQYPQPLTPAVQGAFADARDVLAGLGATLIEAPVPFDFDALMRACGRLISAEAWALHRAYIDDPALPIGTWVRRRVQAGRDVGAADYLAVLDEHRRCTAEWTRWMAPNAALLLPATPFAACPVAEVDETLTPLAAYTRAANFVGGCGLALPAGFDRGLPIGVQLMGAPWGEAGLIRIGRAFQAATDWHRRMPRLAE